MDAIILPFWDDLTGHTRSATGVGLSRIKRDSFHLGRYQGNAYTSIFSCGSDPPITAPTFLLPLIFQNSPK